MSVHDEAETVLTSRQERVLTITLNRPEARNALNRQLLEGLQRAFDNAADDDGIGAVVLTGAGTAFCAGADLKETAKGLGEKDFFTRYERANASLELHRMLPRYPKPVIAAVQGYAVAGGCGLAMSCDIVIAARSAQFGYPEVNRGLVAAMVMVSLSRLVGRHRAMDLLLSGRFIPADEALQLGLANQVVDDEDLQSRAFEYAQSIGRKSPTALRFAKEIFRQIQDVDYDRGLEIARDVNQMLRQTGEARQGAEAFTQGERQAQ